MIAAERLAFAAILAAGLLASSAEAASFTTSNGRTVSLGDIGSMNCGQMQAALAEIDATGYRAGAPEPRNPADMPLFSYELRLADAHYRKCSRPRSGALPGLEPGRSS